MLERPLLSAVEAAAREVADEAAKAHVVATTAIATVRYDGAEAFYIPNRHGVIDVEQPEAA